MSLLTYRMSPSQAQTWRLGDAASAQLAEALARTLLTLVEGDILVVDDTGAPIFVVEQGGAR